MGSCLLHFSSLCPEHSIIVKLVVVILGLNLSFQSLSSNGRFHATGHRMRISFISGQSPCLISMECYVIGLRGDLLMQAEPGPFSVADMQILGELSVILTRTI